MTYKNSTNKRKIRIIPFPFYTTKNTIPSRKISQNILRIYAYFSDKIA